MTTPAQALTEAVCPAAVTVPFARYRFTLRVTEAIMLSDYAGSAIRGAFGRALRRTACMTHRKDCKGCPLYLSCPYTAVFETPPPAEHALQKFSQIPNAYVIEPPERGARELVPGKTVSFDMVLFGRARDHLALLIYAVERAFRFNVSGGKAELVSVAVLRDGCPEVLYTTAAARLAPHDSTTVLAVPASDTLTLSFETPLRLQKNGEPLRAHEITPAALLHALLRRVSLLMEFQAHDPLPLDFRALAAQTEGVRIVSHTLVWQDWRRYSSRQHRQMALGGLTGTVTLSGVPAPYRVLLAIGQLTHAGKNATFGLGKYTVA